MDSLSAKGFLCILFGLTILSLSSCLYERGNEGGVLDQREFDYFVLSLQWPGTICQKTKHCCSSNGCCRSSNAPTEFTIHGLWTNYNDGTWPACCSGSEFDIKEISSLLEGLEKYWPSLSCSSSSTCHGTKGLFWAHEWEKHGTCSFPVFRDEYSYFLATLNVYLKYNVSVDPYMVGLTIKAPYMKELTIKASPIISLMTTHANTNYDKYPLGGIVSAIENAVGATPLLTCKHGAIEELRLCFYKDFKPCDCIIDASSQGDMLASSSCPKYISLPEYTPLGAEDEIAIPWLFDSEAI